MMMRMQNWKRRKIEEFKKEPVSNLEKNIGKLCRNIEKALLTGNFKDADIYFTYAKLYAWAKREKLREMKK